MTERGDAITLVDDEGSAHEFTLVDVVEVASQRYAVLQPAAAGEGAVLFRVEGETLTPVGNDAEFDRVVEALRDLEDYDDLVIEDGPEDGYDDGDTEAGSGA